MTYNNMFQIADTAEGIIKQYDCVKTRELLKTKFLKIHLKEIFECELTFENSYKIFYSGLGVEMTNLHIFVELILQHLRKTYTDIPEYYHHRNGPNPYIYASPKLFDYIDRESDLRASVFDFMNENQILYRKFERFIKKRLKSNDEIKKAIEYVCCLVKKIDKKLATQISKNDEQFYQLFNEFNKKFRNSKMLRIHYIPLRSYEKYCVYDGVYMDCNYFTECYDPNLNNIVIRSYLNNSNCDEYFQLIEDLFNSMPIQPTIPVQESTPLIQESTQSAMSVQSVSEPVQGIPIYYS